MKVAFLNPSAQFGGAETVLFDVLSGLASAEPDWKLELILGEHGPLVERAGALGVRTRVLQMPASLAAIGDAGAGGPAGVKVSRAALALSLLRVAPSALAYTARLRRMLRDASPDVIYTNGFKMHLLAGWAAGSVPLIWHIHDYVSRRPLMSRLLRRYARRVSAAITNSESTARDLRQVCGPGLRRVEAVLNGVDLERFNPRGPKADLDALSGLPPAEGEVLRVGLVATMARWKGHSLFLEALSHLGEVGELRAYVIGGPIYRTRGSEVTLEELRILSERLGLDGRVGFTGPVMDAAAAMRALDIVVHASTAPEPFGLVIVEALACGRPVIASDEGGAAEVVRSVQGALGFAPRQAPSLAAAIRELVLRRSELQDLGAAGRRSAEVHFDRRRLGPAVAAVVREATG